MHDRLASQNYSLIISTTLSSVQHNAISAPSHLSWSNNTVPNVSTQFDPISMQHLIETISKLRLSSCYLDVLPVVNLFSQVSTYRSLLAVPLANLGQHLFSKKKLLPSSSFKLLREKKCYLWKGVTTQTMTKECDNSRWIFEWNAFSGPDPYMFYFRQESLVREKQCCIQLNSQ